MACLVILYLWFFLLSLIFSRNIALVLNVRYTFVLNHYLLRFLGRDPCVKQYVLILPK